MGGPSRVWRSACPGATAASRATPRAVMGARRRSLMRRTCRSAGAWRTMPRVRSCATLDIYRRGNDAPGQRSPEIRFLAGFVPQVPSAARAVHRPRAIHSRSPKTSGMPLVWTVASGHRPRGIAISNARMASHPRASCSVRRGLGSAMRDVLSRSVALLLASLEPIIPRPALGFDPESSARSSAGTTWSPLPTSSAFEVNFCQCVAISCARRSRSRMPTTCRGAPGGSPGSFVPCDAWMDSRRVATCFAPKMDTTSPPVGGPTLICKAL
mmetsp:Transcript_52181/g.138181  ORF Transcript_52181/g.138181 Transcript_52181/m.138181 type:complete len:269 (-) Transcript_52181:766-1572(-)